MKQKKKKNKLTDTGNNKLRGSCLTVLASVQVNIVMLLF